MVLAAPAPNFDIKDNKSFAAKPSTAIQNIVLAANTAQDFTRADWVAADNKKPNVLLFSANGDFYVKWRGTGATIPSGNVVDGTGVDLNPAVRKVDDVDQFSIIAPQNTIVTISLYFY